MENPNPVPKGKFRWLALLAGTVGIHLIVSAACAFMAIKQGTFQGGQQLLPIAVSCLPAVWSVFILWKFRGFAERVVGIVSAISSFLVSYDATYVMNLFIAIMAVIAVICGLLTALIFRRHRVLLTVSISAIAGIAAEILIIGLGEASTAYHHDGYSLLDAIRAGIGAAFLMCFSAPFTGGLPTAFFGYVFHKLFRANPKPSPNPAT